MKVFTDLLTLYTNSGYMIYGIGRGGSTEQFGIHYPWFMIYVKNSGVSKVKEIISEYVKKKFIIDYTIYNPNDITPLILKEFSYEPDPVYVPIEVKCRRKELVPIIANHIQKKANQVLVGEHNIVYSVRASFDYDVKYFHEKCPLLFIPNNELESVAMELIERYRDFKILSFDIEVYTTSGRFPVPGDPILSLQYMVTTLGNPDISEPKWVKDSISTLVANKADSGESEEIAMKFLDVLRRERPDVVVGYNSVAFDLKYLKPFLGLRKDRILSDFHHINLVDYVFPHLDLLLIRKSMGSSLGVRSQVVQALDDVVKEVVKGTKFEWLMNSDLMEAETKLDHTKLVREWRERTNLFYNYITADAYFTLVLGYLWMYTLIILSSLVQVPLSQLSKLNLGQIAEYNFIHWLERLGFRTMATERRVEFRKVSNLMSFGKYLGPSANLFTRGKVYAKSYGIFENILEADFAQLYPTLMSNDTVDPAALRSEFNMSIDTAEPAEASDPLVQFGGRITMKKFPVILGIKSKKSAEYMVPRNLIVIIPTYGPLSFLIYKMFTMRRITKKLKKKAEMEGRPELVAIDQATKILNNASYGALSKKRGFINPVLSGYIFWKTLKILYDVIDYVEKELGLTVLYGDTDSIFVKCKEEDAMKNFPNAASVKEACWKWFRELIVPKINEFVKSTYGKEFELSPEEAFDMCIYPKSKYGNVPSKKSYICVNRDGDKLEVEVVKGEFYKATAPEGIKDRIGEFYAEILKRKPRTPEGVLKIAEEILSKLPPHKYFIKKTIDTYESEKITDAEKTYEFRLKRLNKPFHYASLHILFTTYEKTPEIRENNIIQVLSNIERSGGKIRTVTYLIDAERLVRERGNVIVYFLPSDTPTKFTVFVDYDEKKDVVIVHNVNVKKVDVVSEKRADGVVVDVGYRVEETYAEIAVPRTKILIDALNSSRKYIVDDVSRKLLPALLTPQADSKLTTYTSKDADSDET